MLDHEIDYSIILDVFGIESEFDRLREDKMLVKITKLKYIRVIISTIDNGLIENFSRKLVNLKIINIKCFVIGCLDEQSCW